MKAVAKTFVILWVGSSEAFSNRDKRGQSQAEPSLSTSFACVSLRDSRKTRITAPVEDSLSPSANCLGALGKDSPELSPPPNSCIWTTWILRGCGSFSCFHTTSTPKSSSLSFSNILPRPRFLTYSSTRFFINLRLALRCSN